MEFHKNAVNSAMKPLRFTLSLLGRWPLYPKTQTYKKMSISYGFEERFSKSENNLNKFPKFEVYNSSLISPLWFYFGITTLFLIFVFLMSIVGFCNFFLGWNSLPQVGWDEQEKENFQTNIVPFVLVWSNLLHCTISSVSFFINRKKLVKMLNYYNIAIDQMQITIPKKIKKFVWTSHLGFLIFVIFICYVGYKILYWNLVRGGGLLVGIVTLRPIIIWLGLDVQEDLWKVRAFGVYVIGYVTFASRAMLILFRFKCKLLTHGFKVCNFRLKQFLRNSHAGDYNERSKCERLANDYRILLKLLRRTDFVYGPVVHSYYSSQLVSMCFELYYLAKGSSRSQQSDILGALAILIQNLYIFFTLSLDAAYVSEEAMRGLEIVISSPLSPSENSVHKKYLVSNMRTMFSQPIVLTGSKYFALDRPFIVSMLGAVFTYFIILLQLHKETTTSTITL